MEGKEGTLMPYKNGRPLVDDSIFFRIASFITFQFVWILAKPVLLLMYKTRIFGRKKIRKCKTGVIISNHTTFFDPVTISCLVRPRRMFHTLLEETVEAPFLGTLTRLLGGIPVPTKGKKPMEELISACRIAVKRRNFVHFYPEGECFLYNQNVQPFQSGAFYIAARLNNPVIPVAVVMKPGLFRPHSILGRSRPREEVYVLDAVYPAEFGCIDSEGNINIKKVKELSVYVRNKIQDEIILRKGTNIFYKGKMERIKGVNS